MAWTAPRTWTAGEVVTAAYMNAQVSGNLTAGFTADMFGNTTWNCAIDTTGSTGPNEQTVAGDYVRAGPLVSAWGKVLFGTPTTYGETDCAYYVTPPKACATYLPTGSVAGAAVGSGFYYDKSANDTYVLTVVAYSTNKFVFRFNNVGDAGIGLVCSTRPVVMSTADRLAFCIHYPTTST